MAVCHILGHTWTHTYISTLTLERYFSETKPQPSCSPWCLGQTAIAGHLCQSCYSFLLSLAPTSESFQYTPLGGYHQCVRTGFWMKVTYHSRSSSVYQNPCFTKAGAVSRHVRSAILKVALKQPPTPSAQCPSPSTPRCVIACKVYISRLVPQPRVASWHTGRYSASTCKAVEGKCKSTELPQNLSKNSSFTMYSKTSWTFSLFSSISHK